MPSIDILCYRLDMDYQDRHKGVSIMLCSAVAIQSFAALAVRTLLDLATRSEGLIRRANSVLRLPFFLHQARLCPLITWGQE